jgi:transposase InsO family protein
MMVITDRLGKGVMLKAMRDIMVEIVAKWFAKTYYRRHRLPRAIVSDWGKQFVGALWGRVCKLLGITRRLSTAYYPETDGSTERMNQTIETFLYTFVDYDQVNWAGLLPHTELAINNRDATSIGVSPFFLSHGYHIEPV